MERDTKPYSWVDDAYVQDLNCNRVKNGLCPFDSVEDAVAYLSSPKPKLGEPGTIGNSLGGGYNIGPRGGLLRYTSSGNKSYV